MTFMVGAGAGFSGDRTDAAIPVVEELIRRSAPSALIFETLGERTLAEAQLARRNDPAAGYEPLLGDFLAPVLGACIEHDIPVLGNFGAANPAGAGRLVAELATRAGYPDTSIAVITGDDIRSRLYEMDLEPWEAETAPLPEAADLIAANVYLGAQPMARALRSGARVVVGGRVADAALVLAPVAEYFDWAWDDWHRLAAGMMAGHLVECGTQITGGYFADPGRKNVFSPATLGYPLAEVESDGRIVITKPPGTGGQVTEQTVKEQLLYEVHDPARYVTPDVIVDLSRATVRQIGADRVEVGGIRGLPAPEKLKVTVSYEGGWLGEGEISYAGPGALNRARLAADIVRGRLDMRVPDSVRRRLDVIGCVSVFDDDAGSLSDAGSAGAPPEDVRLRLAVEHAERAWVERATQEVLALYCCGPAGGGGVRRHHRSRIKTSSFLVPRDCIQPRIDTHVP